MNCYFHTFFDKQLILIGTVVYAFFPLNVYAVSQISSITLQVFLINIFFLYFVKIFKKPNLKYISIFSIVSALLILLRGEFLVFVLFSHIYLLLKHKCLKKIIISILLIIIFISPYLYRNYDIFGQITITKSFGFNLLKGNHPGTSVEGVGLFGDEDNLALDTKAKLDELNEMGPIKGHDLLKDQIFLEQAIIYIKEDPLRYLKLYIQKFFAFLFFDINSSYLNYFSIFHLLPKILLSLTTIVGIFISISLSKNITNYFILFYVGNIGLFSFFFILPRYSLSLLTVQIILSLFFVEKIQKKTNYKNHEKFR